MTAVGYVGGDPDKLDRAGYTLGDVLAADATGTLIPVALGTPAEVLTVDLAEPADVGWGSAAGGSGLKVRRLIVTSGAGTGTTFPDTAGAWEALADLTLTIPAVVGDWIEASFNALFDLDSSSFLDLAVSNGGTLVRFFGSDSGTPLVEGNPAYYPDPVFNGFPGQQGFSAAVGDINAGNVTVVVAVKAIGAGKYYKTANFPFQMLVKNYGQVT